MIYLSVLLQTPNSSVSVLAWLLLKWKQRVYCAPPGKHTFSNKWAHVDLPGLIHSLQPYPVSRVRYGIVTRGAGFTDHLCPCGPSLHPPQELDVHLPKFLILRQGDAAAQAVIGSLTKTWRRTKTGSRPRQSVCVVIALHQRGTIIEPLASLSRMLFLCLLLTCIYHWEFIWMKVLVIWLYKY